MPWVRSYVRSDGTPVRGYSRRAPGAERETLISQEARADAADRQRRAAQREAERPVGKCCGRKFTDGCWEGVTVHRTAVRAGDKSVCGPCHAGDVARNEATAQAARLEAAAPVEPERGPGPARGRGWFRQAALTWLPQVPGKQRPAGPGP